MISTLLVAISIASAVVAIGVDVYVEYLDRKEERDRIKEIIGREEIGKNDER